MLLLSRFIIWFSSFSSAIAFQPMYSQFCIISSLLTKVEGKFMFGHSLGHITKIRYKEDTDVNITNLC